MTSSVETRIKRYTERLDASEIHVLTEADKVAYQIEALAVAARESGHVLPADYAMLTGMATAAGLYLIERGKQVAARGEYYRVIAEQNAAKIQENSP